MRIQIVATGEVPDAAYANELARQLRAWFGASSIESVAWAEPHRFADLKLNVEIALPLISVEAADQIIDREIARMKETIHFVIEAHGDIDQLSNLEDPQ